MANTSAPTASTPTPTPAPATASTPATATTPAPVALKPAPLKKLVTPFPGPKNPSDGTFLELPVDQFLRTWGQAALDGFYPLGRNGQWHGGIHFDEGTQAKFNQGDGIRCIADGEVIAYRYDTEPPKSRYVNFEHVNAQFATSFVLVRHRLQVPPEIAGTTTPPPSCVFYSLYMHLQHWKIYEDDETIKRPPFWKKDPKKGWVGEKAKDPAPSDENWKDSAPPAGKSGLRVRNTKEVTIIKKIEPTDQKATNQEGIGQEITEQEIKIKPHDVIGWVPRGVQITYGATPAAGAPGYRMIESIVGDSFQLDGLEQDYLKKHGKVFIDELDPFFIGPELKDAVYPLPEPVKIEAGALIGHLGNYLRFNPEVLNSAVNRTAVHLEVFAGPELKGFVERCRALEEKAPDSTKQLLLIERGAKPVVWSSHYPLTLKQGELLMPSKNSPPDGVFIKLVRGTMEVKPRSDLTDWDDKKHTYEKGKKLFYGALKEDGTGFEYALPFIALPKTTQGQYAKRKVFTPDESKPIWVFRELYRSRLTGTRRQNRHGIIEVTGTQEGAWDKFPLEVGQNEVSEAVIFEQVLDVKNKENPKIKAHAIDDNGVRWWQIEYPLPDLTALAFMRISGSRRTRKDKAKGWVCAKDHAKVKFCSPWAWPGFYLNDEDPTSPVDWFKQRLLKNYTPSSPLLKLLFNLLDTDDSKQLSDAEIREGWKNPALAQPLSRQIIEHKSEWGIEMSELEALGEYMLKQKDKGKLIDNYINFAEVWEEEKKRIEKLQFWKDVKGKHGFPSDIKVWHVHPLAWVENFAKKGCGCKEITAELLRAISGASNSNATLYAPHFIDMFNRFGIKECISKAHILAQMFHESGSLQFTRELGQNLSYDPWRGRGLLQVTFQENYAAYGSYVGEDFTSSQAAREKLESVPHAVYSVAWFWASYKKLTSHSDADDFIYCTAVVNGAYNGYNHRLSMLNKSIELLEMQEHVKKNRNGIYLFEESAVYNNARFSFAWGLWHDTGSNKQGVTKDTNKAITGYKRFLQLDTASPTQNRNWYGMTPSAANRNAQWYRDYARGRVTALGGVL
jgi:predicted chitinase